MGGIKPSAELLGLTLLVSGFRNLFCIFGGAEVVEGVGKKSRHPIYERAVPRDDALERPWVWLSWLLVLHGPVTCIILLLDFFF